MINGKAIYAASGETVLVSNNWEAEAEARGATVASSAWDGLSVSTEALVDSLATALLTVGDSGCIRNTVTLSNGEVLTNERAVWVL